MTEEMKVTEEEKKIIEERRKRQKDAEEYADWQDQYDNCYGKF